MRRELIAEIGDIVYADVEIEEDFSFFQDGVTVDSIVKTRVTTIEAEVVGIRIRNTGIWYEVFDLEKERLYESEENEISLIMKLDKRLTCDSRARRGVKEINTYIIDVPIYGAIENRINKEK